MAENTGYLIYARLKKVGNGGAYEGVPLDVNNIPCSISGLPQAEKDNTSGTEGYAAPIENLTACPLNDFTLTPIVDAELSTEYESNIITVKGIQGSASLAVLNGGQFSKNGGAYTAVPSTCINGDTVKVKNTSSASNSTEVSISLKIGSVVKEFIITTKSA